MKWRIIKCGNFSSKEKTENLNVIMDFIAFITNTFDFCQASASYKPTPLLITLPTILIVNLTTDNSLVHLMN